MADAAVVEKTSGAPGGGPVLKGDNLDQFAKAIGGQPAEESAPAAPEAGAPAEPTQEESAPEVEETPAPESTPAPARPAAAKPAAEPPKGPIPYERFKEINDQLNAERAQIAEYRRSEQQRIVEAANAQSATTLFKIAEEHPELAPLIFRGEKPAPKPQVDPNAPKLTPEQQAIQEIKTQNKALMNWKEQTEKAAILQKIQDRAEAQIEKHPIFLNPVVRDLGEQLIVKEILTKPHVSPEVIVDQIAKGFKDLEASIKEQYLEKKKTTAKTVVPGVGSGGPPAPPAQPAKKLKLSDGSALKALQAALSGMNSES